MTPPVVPCHLPELVGRARALADRARAEGRRAILGITGPPGAGKSTLARRLVAALGADAVEVGMDGFHLANAVLEARGARDRKGAVDTFDAHGYAALLVRLRAAAPGGPTVYAPAFRRDLEEPIAGAVPVPADVPLVVTEGNYLLLDAPGWRAARATMDEVWYVAAPEELRLSRLVARHATYGKSAEDAYRWAHGSDQVNAELVATTRDAADLVVEV